MSDTDNQKSEADIETFVDNDPEAIEVEATLVHGEVYYLANKRFNRGVPVPVTNAERELLEDEEHAADQLSFEGSDGIESHTRSKFTFAALGTGVKPVATAAPEAPAPARRRSAARQ